MEKEILVSVLKNTLDNFTTFYEAAVLWPYICIQIKFCNYVIYPDKDIHNTVNWFRANKEYIVPDQFRGRYWVGDSRSPAWWNMGKAKKSNELELLIQLKKDYLAWLIDQIEQDKITSYKNF